MKKYLYIIKTTFNDSLTYLSSLLLRFVGFLIIIFVLITLWDFIYSDGTNIIKGYTFNNMIWYLLLTETISFTTNSKIARNEVSKDIKTGNIAYQINKPYNYIIYIICRYIADTILRFITIAIIAIILGLLFAGSISNFNIITLLSAIPIYFFAILIMGLISILISLSSFWVEESKPFHNIYSKFILIFGIFFPIEMFPKLVGNILKYTPVYSVSYGPASLIINYSFKSFLSILLSQTITILIVIALIAIVYKKGVRNLNVNGG